MLTFMLYHYRILFGLLSIKSALQNAGLGVLLSSNLLYVLFPKIEYM